MALTRFIEDGAEHLPQVLLPTLPLLLDLVANLPQDRAGTRITGNTGLRSLLAPNGPISLIAARRLGPKCRAVRAVLFDKNAALNWSLAWHQDRTICVTQRIETEGFGPWTIKQGLHHVEPPFALIERMVTLRIHLDDVPADNAPLLIAKGSHHKGRIAERDIDAVVRDSETMACLAKAGDVWLYATSILHASRSATIDARRRVLQVDFSADMLPGGLEWTGI